MIVFSNLSKYFSTLYAAIENVNIFSMFMLILLLYFFIYVFCLQTLYKKVRMHKLMQHTFFFLIQPPSAYVFCPEAVLISNAPLLFCMPYFLKSFLAAFYMLTIPVMTSLPFHTSLQAPKSSAPDLVNDMLKIPLIPAAIF